MGRWDALALAEQSGVMMERAWCSLRDGCWAYGTGMVEYTVATLEEQ